MITIYLGDVSEYLKDLAQSQDVNAQLVTENNFKNLLPGTYYTSLGDIGGLYNLGVLLQQSNKIIYAPPIGRWSGGADQKKWTEDYLKVFSLRSQVENYSIPIPDPESMLELVDQRKSNHNQLWISGCSISHGIGVDKSSRYGELIASRLNLPVSFLTCPGSSIIWSADQLLRSDIREGDTVVWGLTSSFRLPYYADNKLIHVNGRLYQQQPTLEKIVKPDALLGKNNLYQTLTSVHSVINFCQKIKANLVVASLMDNDIVHYIRDYPNLIMLSNLWGRESKELFFDLGLDNEHPGPRTHQFYADEICNKLNFML
jgi:hypothetical protein